jgi:hypothetical protein
MPTLISVLQGSIVPMHNKSTLVYNLSARTTASGLPCQTAYSISQEHASTCAYKSAVSVHLMAEAVRPVFPTHGRCFLQVSSHIASPDKPLGWSERAFAQFAQGC